MYSISCADNNFIEHGRDRDLELYQGEYEIFDVVTLTLSLSQYRVSRSVAAVVSGFCFIIVAAVIVLGLGELFLLFVLSVYSYTIASHSWETYESCYMILSFRPKHNQLLHFRTQDLTHETVSR